jgi:hypothetical protein
VSEAFLKDQITVIRQLCPTPGCYRADLFFEGDVVNSFSRGKAAETRTTMGPLDNFETQKRKSLEVLACDLTASPKQLSDAFQLA